AAPTWAAAAAAVTQQASSGAPTNGGTYNFGSSVSERSVGAMTSGGFASPNNLLGFFQNTNASNITGLTISYDAERYRVNTALASVQFFYSLNGTAWTAVTAGDIATASFPTGASAYNFTTGTVINRTGISITGLNIATNSNIYLRWNINTTGASSQGIAIDNVSVTATFAVAGFSVTYSDNSSTSGTVPTDATSYAFGDTPTVLGNTGTLARTGYTFAGWNTLANGLGANYLAGDTFSISANTTLYARWTPNNNTITFNGNGATSGSMSTQTIATAATAPLAGNGFSRVGYTFAGWATTPTGAVAYTDGAPYTMGTADVTLYAVWNTIAPFITTSGTLTALSTIYGTASSNTTFTVSAGNLTNNLIITAPTGFEVSLTAGSGFATSIDLGTIDRTNTTIYVRLAANTDFGTYSGDVVAFSTVLTSANVPTV
ncbi:MAG: InlB B-repeat-containing protein, partial [Dolichospermum sp.]